MQNKQYIIEFFFSLPNYRLHSLSPSSDHRTCRTCRAPRIGGSHAFCRAPRCQGTHQTHGKSQSHGKRFELTEKSFCPLANPHLYTEHDIYGMEYFHWPAWAICLALLPSQLISRTEESEKVLDLLATAKKKIVINIFLILNPKHKSY